MRLLHFLSRQRRSLLIGLLLLGVVGVGACTWWQRSRPDYRLTQARIALELGDPEPAKRLALRLEASGDRDRARLLRACLLIHDRQYAKALEHLNQVRDQDALRREAAALSGRCLLELGEPFQAERAFLFVLHEDADHVDAQRGLAAAYFDEGDLPHALVHCAAWARLAPDDGKPHRFMGFIHRTLEKHDQAVPCFRAALARKLDNEVREEVRLELADSLIKRGEFQAALDTLGESDPPAEALPRKLTLTAESARGLGQAPRAKALVEEALDIDPSYVPALRLAGMLSLDDKQFGAAVRALERAAALDPHDFTVRHGLAQAYVGLGRTDAARAEQAKIKETQTLLDELNRLSEQVMKSPRDAAAHRQLAEVFDKLNRPADAARSRRNAQVLKAGPTRPQSLDAIP